MPSLGTNFAAKARKMAPSSMAPATLAYQTDTVTICLNDDTPHLARRLLDHLRRLAAASLVRNIVYIWCRLVGRIAL